MDDNLPKCCVDFHINPLDLIFPERLPEDGKEFLDAHDIWDIPLRDLLKDSVMNADGSIEVYHRCDKLGDGGLCRIYANRPKICRDYDCSTRKDCACKGKGKICQHLPL